MKRIDYYAGIFILAALFLFGDGDTRWMAAKADSDTQKSDTAPKIIEAQQFRLVDSSGKRKAVLMVLPDGSPALSFFGKNDKGLLTLSVIDGSAPCISMRDSDGKLRSMLTLDEGNGNSELAMFDSKEKIRTQYSINGQSDSENGEFAFYDKSGKTRLLITSKVDNGQVALVYKDSQGHAVRALTEEGLLP